MSGPFADDATAGLTVLRIAHSAVVSAWRERERTLIRSGVDLTLVSARAWDEGGSTVPLQPDGDDFVIGVRTWGRRPNLFCFDPRTLWGLFGRDWDIIDIHEEPCSLATAEILLIRWLRRRRAPYLLYSAQNIEKRYPVPFRWTERAALANAGAASVCNLAAARILKGKGLAGPAAVIPLGVDVEHFSAADRPPPGDVWRIGYVGRLAPHKGVQVLIDAVAGRPRWALRIAGAGPEEAALKDQVRRLGASGQITFEGSLDHGGLARFYRSVDVVAIPSIPVSGWEEQFCRVAVEAMAAGVPIVASRTGALPEVVGDAGVLTEPGDPTALAVALGHLASEPGAWTALRRNGIARSSKFSWDSVADRYLNLYRELHERKSSLAEAVTGPAPPVQVAVVAYGDPGPLETCLEALGGAFPVVVVDNTSSQPTRVVVDRHGATYVDPGRNVGFAAGVNLALSQPRPPGADVLLLNPDAVIDAGAVLRLQQALRDDPRLACVAPAQRGVDNPAPAKVSWPVPTPARAWIDALGLGRLQGPDRFSIGSVLLLRAEALDEVGYLDERFFLYGEEADWQIRARRFGWRSGLSTEVVAIHTGAGTGGDPIRRETHFHASHERLIRKYHGPWGWAICRSGCLFGALIRSAIGPPERRRAARMRWRLYWTGPCRAEARLRPAPIQQAEP